MKIQNINSTNHNQNICFNAKIIKPQLLDEFKTAYGDELIIDLGKRIKRMPFVYQGFISKEEAEKLLKQKIISKAEAEELLTREIISEKESSELCSKIKAGDLIILHPDDDEQLTNRLQKISNDIRNDLGLKPKNVTFMDLEPEVDLQKVKKNGQRKNITEIIQESEIYKTIENFITQTKELTKKEIEDAAEKITRNEKEIKDTRLGLLT